MAHLDTSYVLITIRPQYSSSLTGTFSENVLHYRIDPPGLSLVDLQDAATTFATLWDLGIQDLISPNQTFNGILVKQETGTTILDTAGLGTNSGTLTGTTLPEVLCAIVGKRSETAGAGRFGHICHPGLTEGIMDGTEHINDTFAASLKTFYDQFKDMSTDTGGFGQPMVLWNATLDTTKVVDEIRVNKQVRTQRHRAPGRGV